MSKINQIEKKLKEIDATKFHKLVDAYLNKKYRYQIHSIGTKIGEDKPTIGTPDTLIKICNNEYIMVEYTTQKTGVKKKFVEDLIKCFDEIKTGISIKKIKKIILACNSKLNSLEIEELSTVCDQKNVECEILTNSLLSNDLNNHYPNLLRDFLEIEVDSGQILDYDDFIKTYDVFKGSTPLSTKFKFREKEKETFKSYISNNSIILITGAPGIGKTRYALEVCDIYVSQNSYKLKTILNRGGDLSDEIKMHFDNEHIEYIIFIDDVNRVHKALEYIKEYYFDKLYSGKIKIVMTVRSYAKEKILEMIPSGINNKEIQLNRLSSKEIRKLARSEFGIRNDIFLEKIDEMSQGNPRLAMMISDIAKKENDLKAIYDVTIIYDKYFSNIKAELEIFKDEKLLLTITIIAFFRVIDKKNEIHMKLIENIFFISSEIFWEKIEILNKLEIVDLYENHAVKISDQILSTYLFYKIVFIEKKVNISIFLENLFLNYSNRFVDILNPLLNTFDSKSILNLLKKPIDDLWDQHKENEINLYKIIEHFHFLKETNILIYLNNKIENLPVKVVDITSLEFWDNNTKNNDQDNILKILSLLKYNLKLINEKIELLINYFKKNISELPKIIEILTKDYGYKNDSYRYGYIYEKKLIDKLWELSKNGEDELISKLFIRVSSYFLKIEFVFFRVHRKSLNYGTFPLILTKELKELRKCIFNNVFVLYSNKKYKHIIIKLFKEYSIGIGTEDDLKVINEDKTIILNLMRKNINNKSYQECKMINELLNFFDRLSIVYDDELRNVFQHETYTLEKILFVNKYDLKEKKGNDLLLKTLDHFYEDFLLSDWKVFFDNCKQIFKNNHQESWLFKTNMTKLFENLAKTNIKLYVEVFEEYLQLDNPFSLKLNLSYLIDYEGKNKAYKILNSYKYKHKDEWLFDFYFYLPLEKIEKIDIKNIINLYKTSKLQNLPYHLEYLEKYLLIESNLLINIINILIKRSENESIDYSSGYNYIFNPHTKIFGEMEFYFKENLNLLKRIYFICINEDSNSEVLNKILNLDTFFIKEYIDKIFNGKDFIFDYDIKQDFEMIWNRNDYKEIFLMLIERVFKIQKNKYIYTKGEILNSFFPRDKKEITIKMDNLLKKYIDDNFSNDEKIIFIFEMICNFNFTKRKEFLRHFFVKNKSFKIFDKIKLSSSSGTWSGSFVPQLERKKDYFESLLDIMVGIEMLPHRKKIEEKIKYLEQEIETYKKNDFMDDF